MIKSKIAKGAGILYKARKTFQISTLKTLYYSIIYPYLTYCIEVWGRASKIHLDSLFKIQKKIVRIVNSADYLAHTDPIFLDLKLLKLSDSYILYIMTFIFTFIKGCYHKHLKISL